MMLWKGELMAEFLMIAVLLISCFSIGIAIGTARRNMEEMHKAEKTERCCETCSHWELEWDEEPCDSCSGHCNWEEDNGDS